MDGTAQMSGSDDDRTLVLAFYIVVDVSYSMSQAQGASGEAPISAVNQILPKVIDAIDQSPTLGDIVRLGAMDFADDAQVVLRLGDLRDVDELPVFDVRGGTSYAAAFRLLRREIEQDYAQLRGDNYKVYRPAVFFVTDGEPTDSAADLKSAFEELTDASFKARPNIIPFGVGGATKDLLDAWVYPKPAESKKPMRSYVAAEKDAAVAISQIGEILIGSIVASANSVSDSGTTGGFVLPDDEDLDDDWI